MIAAEWGKTTPVVVEMIRENARELVEEVTDGVVNKVIYDILKIKDGYAGDIPKITPDGARRRVSAPELRQPARAVRLVPRLQDGVFVWRLSRARLCKNVAIPTCLYHSNRIWGLIKPKYAGEKSVPLLRRLVIDD